jgi:Tol biopolymer transport system component
LTYHRGNVSAAKFLADGNTVVYSAAWNGGPVNLYTTRTDVGGETPLGIDGKVLSISASGEMLVLRNRKVLFGYAEVGELDRVPVSGGGPRPITENIQDASFAPDGGLAVCRYVSPHYQLEYPMGKTLFETTGFLRAPRVSPKTGQLAFLFHPQFGDDSGSVAMLDRAGHMRELTPRYNRINGLAWSPSGDELWFSAVTGMGRGGALYAVTAKGKVRQVLASPEQLALLDASPNGSLLVATQQETATPMFSGPELPADRDVAVSLWTVGVDISSDAKYLLLDDESGERYAAVLAKTDGSAPVRLGEGEAMAISPDGHWVLTLDNSTPQQYTLLPTGAGEPKQVTHDAITHTIPASWLPDSRHFLYTGSEPGHKQRAYLQDISGGPARAVTPEGLSAGPVSPDGSHFVARDVAGNSLLYSLERSSAPAKMNVAASERVHGWLDTWHVYLSTPPITTISYSLDVRTGKREILKRIAVPDPAGLDTLVPVIFARDGKHYVYTVGRLLSELQLVKGVK